MISRRAAQIEAGLYAADFFGKEYVRSRFGQKHPVEDNTCVSITKEPYGGLYEAFFGFHATGGFWDVYAHMNVDASTGKVFFLDYRLPNGQRMNNPKKISPHVLREH